MILATVAALVSVATGVYFAGQAAHSATTDIMNKDIRSKVYSLANDIRKAVDAKRLDANKLLALYQQRNNNALYGYVIQNPLISRSVSSIQADSEKLAALSSELNSIDTEIQNLVNQMGSLGYQQTHGGVAKDKKALKAAEQELNEKKRKYEKVHDEIKNFHESNNQWEDQVSKGLTSDLDAKSQNVLGGLKDA